MSTTSQEPLTKPVIVGRFIDVRYMTLVGLTVLAYDILLTLDVEAKVIWNSPKRTSSKTLYMLYRYNTIVGGAFFLIFLIPMWDYSNEWAIGNQHLYLTQEYREDVLTKKLSSFRCTRAGIACIALAVVLETVGNAIVLNELLKLWESSKNMLRMMTAGFVLVHSGTIIAAVIAITQLEDALRFLKVDNTSFRMCVSSTPPPAFKCIFIPSVILEVYWSLLLLLNAMSRPRSTSQSLLSLLWGDGLVFFSMTFSLRVLSLLITMAAPAPIDFLGVAMPILLVNTVVCRLYLWLNSPDGLLLRQRLFEYGKEKDGWSDETELQSRSTHSSIVQ